MGLLPFLAANSCSSRQLGLADGMGARHTAQLGATLGMTWLVDFSSYGCGQLGLQSASRQRSVAGMLARLDIGWASGVWALGSGRVCSWLWLCAVCDCMGHVGLLWLCRWSANHHT
eukprot:COSAG01_NODE_1280_length_10925_cov_23.969333_9_plen_116_part_00